MPWTSRCRIGNSPHPSYPPVKPTNGTDLINHESVTTYPNSCLGQVRPHGNLLPGRHVRVAIPAEGLLQFVQLLRGEVCPLASLAFVLLVVLAAAGSAALVLATAVARYRRPRSVTTVVVGQATADVFRLHRGGIDTCDCVENGGGKGNQLKLCQSIVLEYVWSFRGRKSFPTDSVTNLHKGSTRRTNNFNHLRQFVEQLFQWREASGQMACGGRFICHVGGIGWDAGWPMSMQLSSGNFTVSLGIFNTFSNIIADYWSVGLIYDRSFLWLFFI